MPRCKSCGEWVPSHLNQCWNCATVVDDVSIEPPPLISPKAYDSAQRWATATIAIFAVSIAFNLLLVVACFGKAVIDAAVSATSLREGFFTGLLITGMILPGIIIIVIVPLWLRSARITLSPERPRQIFLGRIAVLIFQQASLGREIYLRSKYYSISHRKRYKLQEGRYSVISLIWYVLYCVSAISALFNYFILAIEKIQEINHVIIGITSLLWLAAAIVTIILIIEVKKCGKDSYLNEIGISMQ
jgi:hypothetical protein